MKELTALSFRMDRSWAPSSRDRGLHRLNTRNHGICLCSMPLSFLCLCLFPRRDSHKDSDLAARTG